MRDLLCEGVMGFGFCYAIDNSIIVPTRILESKFGLYGNNPKCVYVELLKRKPKDKKVYGYWFPLTEEGVTKRIEILEEIISNM
jgi:hypothetical protein